ncbi:uncharacterized protein VICG_01998 [Vittaforma corneae ATCC 50505]|uniref:Uncharacterized protein n=1 Tax=Vittaforma corneae (strain ATCC 50505) TaxID=993615 RepID=L2GJB2_VITCO|nr:uncharacterized protein VICG_01998 [Vittaforma corneae ATCC 50505]ELA40968.1 hypothetical protein VICG_01998 [Vittaforma corneae ATCC 50505]
MSTLLSNSKFIVSFNGGFKIYNANTLKLYKTLKEQSCNLFELSGSTIFFTNDYGLLTYNIETEKRTEAIKAHGNTKVSSIFVNGSFLYLGYDNGTLEVHTFNEHLFKLHKTYRHPGIVSTIKSDNIKIYVTDLRNRITMYPENACFDFIQPKIFFDRCLYAISENKVYVNTKDAFGFLFELKDDVDEVVFSPLGGIMFTRNIRGVRCYDCMGQELGRFFANEFTVVSREGRCYIVEEQDGVLKSMDTYLRDIEKVEMQFTKVNIKEKTVSAEEYEQKYSYIDDGNKRSFPKHRLSIGKDSTSKSSANSKENGVGKRDIQDSTGETSENKSNVKISKRQVMVSSEESEVFANNPATPAFNPNTAVLKRNPSSYENQEARLHFFSSEGYMISLESALSSQVYIKFHNHETDSIEIKDTLKSTLGSFCGENFVLSDGNVINFNDVWQKPIPCSLLGIDRNFIYAFDCNNLNIIDFRGNVVRTIYTPDSYSFCVEKGNEQQIAIFCKTCIMMYKDKEVEYIPACNIDFGCFDGSTLYVRIGREIFGLQGRVLVKVYETDERPLTVSENTLVTLSENTLLPRPAVRYHPLKHEKIEEVEIDSLRFGKYKQCTN